MKREGKTGTKHTDSGGITGERAEFLKARSARFLRMTQGKGKPMSYPTGTKRK